MIHKSTDEAKSEVEEPLYSLTYRSLPTLQALINGLWCTKQCQEWLRIESEHQDREEVVNALQERMEELVEQDQTDCHSFCPHQEGEDE